MKKEIKIIKKTVCAIFAFIIMATMLINATYVTEAETNNKHIRSGGINQIDEVHCKSKGETIALESKLRKEGYIQVSGKGMNITQKEFNLFCKGKLSPIQYPDYINKRNDNTDYAWVFLKTYVYKPYFDSAMKQITSGKDVSEETLYAIHISTVVIDYGMWYDTERVGKVVNEYNDTIPSWENETGFLQITSPTNIIIKIKNMATNTFNELYVKANKPLLVKLMRSGYIVTKINATDIPEKEEMLPYNNNIQVETIDTIDKPYKLDLGKTIAKYKITSISLDGKPDCSYKSKKITNSKDDKKAKAKAKVKPTPTPKKK